ncbi:hypothetical protein FFI94_022225 [Rhodococcus sp. KBS0724]|uniref:phage tail termination protein n=1 Tax=Rhodococcus sp. KBS0724 TaxID=1179674 RepID=UPI00110F2FF1|nr:hypothetical protein [Rhodococcus sp. KBS0724]TSD48583.1 hypothetical protein FFI94_022225 [Rhodococcus sp. KBS0724]
MTWQFPDAENVMCDLLDPIAPASTWLGDDWEKNLPQIQVNRIGGGLDPDEVTDTARLQVAVFAVNRAEVQRLNTLVRNAVREAEFSEVGGVQIDTTSEAIAGQQVPDSNPDDRRVISTYTLAFREQDL